MQKCDANAITHIELELRIFDIIDHVDEAEVIR